MRQRAVLGFAYALSGSLLRDCHALCDFDIEVIFLYPWAVTFNQLGIIGFIEMMIFIGLFVVAYVYAWRKGALEWD